MSTITVSNASTRALLQFCQSRAVDVKGLLSHAGLAQKSVEDSNARLRADQMFAIWEEAQKQTRDKTTIELRVAALVPFGSFHIPSPAEPF
jgi:hypothetical protein